jgi:hypothetical protein
VNNRFTLLEYVPTIKIYSRGILTAKVITGLVVVMIAAALMFAPPLPERIIPWWNENQCWWFNGTIEDKYVLEADGIRTTKDYVFIVNGTLNPLENDTVGMYYDPDTSVNITVAVHGGYWDYEYFEIGEHYEGYMCDSMTLREAVINGTIEFLIWGAAL